MTPRQSRMARAALGWSRIVAAAKMGIAHNTLVNFETGRYAGEPETRAAIRRAYEGAGIMLTDRGIEVVDGSLVQ